MTDPPLPLPTDTGTCTLVWVARGTQAYREIQVHTQAHTDIQYKYTHTPADIHKHRFPDIVTDINTQTDTHKQTCT